MFDHLVSGHQATVRFDATTLFVSLELSKSRWLVTASAPGSTKFSKHSVPGGDATALLELLKRLRATAEQRLGAPVAIAAIAEAGLDGFWLHRLLERHGIASHIVDPASIAVPRRHRRAKTDRIDGEGLLRTLMAHADEIDIAFVVPTQGLEPWSRCLPRSCSFRALTLVHGTSPCVGRPSSRGWRSSATPCASARCSQGAPRAAATA